MLFLENYLRKSLKQSAPTTLPMKKKSLVVGVWMGCYDTESHTTDRCLGQNASNADTRITNRRNNGKYNRNSTLIGKVLPIENG